jgi:hypothetical protein
MSQVGKPASETVEDPALEQERDDAPETGLDEGVDAASVEGDDEPLDPDAGEEAGEGEDDAGVDGDGGRAHQVRQPSRAQRRIESLAKSAREAKEEAAAARREAADLRARIDGRQTETEAALERERVALMSPEERLEHRITKMQQENERARGQAQLQLADISDRSSFSAACARNTVLSDIADEVEAQLAEARRAGINLPRTTIAERILGQRLLARAGRAKPKQVRAGAERVARETVRPPGGGASNVSRSPGRTSEAAARAKRLAEMEI